MTIRVDELVVRFAFPGLRVIADLLDEMLRSSLAASSERIGAHAPGRDARGGRASSRE
jgi:hypothetical protein